MKLSFKLITLSIAFLSQIAPAQVATGMPPHGSFGGGPFDTVNLGNLNVNFVIPVFHKSGRGTPFTYDLSYDSSIWTPVTSGGVTQWQPASNWGWRGITEAQTGYLTYQTSYTTDVNGCRTTYYSYAYHDPYGAAHAFAGSFQAVSYYFKNGCLGLKFNALNTTSTDGSGYHLTVTTIGQLAGQLTDRGGRLITAPLNITNGAATYTDNNGNQLSVSSSGVFTDTLGTTALTVSGSGTPSSPTIFTYTAPSGGNAQYKMNYTAYTVATGFSISGIGEYGPVTNVPLVSSIHLPDGTSYQFTYESGPSSCSPCVTGRIKEVTLATGGTITYSYTGGSHGIESDGSTAGLTRTLSPGGEWQYSRTKQTGTPGPGSTWTTTVNDPAGNETDVNFAEDSTITNLTAIPPTTATYNLYETQRVVKQLVNNTQTPLLTTERCYSGNYTNCATTTVSSPIDTIDSYSQPVNGNTRGSHIEYNGSFSGSGLVSVDEEYDYGVTMGASLSSFHALRDTAISYASLSNQYGPIYDKPSSLAVYDCSTGTCSKISSTGYNYDQTTPTATSGTPQHISITGSRGNATTVTTSTSSSASLSKTFTYYDTGNVYQANDVNGAQTSYAYGDCGNSFPTTISEPLSMSRTMTWSCTGGVLTGVTDENGNSMAADYTTDPDFWRPDYTLDYAGYKTTWGYSETATESNLTFGSSVSDYRATVDGFGRPILSQQEQGPSLNEYDTVQTNYNTLGQVSGTTMPFQAAASTTSSTAPATSIQYDAMGRPTSVSDAGGGTVSYTYTKNDVLVAIGPAPSGEHLKQRQLEYDGLGRLASVCELTASSNGGYTCGQAVSQTGYWTRYKYDATGRLIGVCQNTTQPLTVDCVQTPSSGQQTRTYSYDWLGRLTSEKNPESGITTYVYDSTSTPCNGGGPTGSNGDLMMRTDASHNCSVYFYDALHRVTDVGNNLPSATNPCRRFRYDNHPGYKSSTPPGTLTNTMGRLMEAATDDCSSPTPDTILTNEWFSYGPRGPLAQAYESTPNSGGYYESVTAYAPNYAVGSIGLYNNTGAALGNL